MLEEDLVLWDVENNYAIYLKIEPIRNGVYEIKKLQLGGEYHSIGSLEIYEYEIEYIYGNFFDHYEFNISLSDKNYLGHFQTSLSNEIKNEFRANDIDYPSAYIYIYLNEGRVRDFLYENNKRNLWELDETITNFYLFRLPNDTE